MVSGKSICCCQLRLDCQCSQPTDEPQNEGRRVVANGQLERSPVEVPSQGICDPFTFPESANQTCGVASSAFDVPNLSDDSSRSTILRNEPRFDKTAGSTWSDPADRRATWPVSDHHSTTLCDPLLIAEHPIIEGTSGVTIPFGKGIGTASPATKPSAVQPFQPTGYSIDRSRQPIRPRGEGSFLQRFAAAAPAELIHGARVCAVFAILFPARYRPAR